MSVSAHFWGGYVLPLNDKNLLDVSAKYLWTRVGSNNANIAGDSIHFDRVNSHRLQLNAVLELHYREALTIRGGLGYEYEFDGKANATTYSIFNINAPSVKGPTGVVSIGAHITPTAKQNFSLDLNAYGSIGEREGVGVGVNINYSF